MQTPPPHNLTSKQHAVKGNMNVVCTERVLGRVRALLLFSSFAFFSLTQEEDVPPKAPSTSTRGLVDDSTRSGDGVVEAGQRPVVAKVPNDAFQVFGTDVSFFLPILLFVCVPAFLFGSVCHNTTWVM